MCFPYFSTLFLHSLSFALNLPLFPYLLLRLLLLSSWPLRHRYFFHFSFCSLIFFSVLLFLCFLILVVLFCRNRSASLQLSSWSGLSKQMLLGMSPDCLQQLIMEFQYDLTYVSGSWEDVVEEQRRWEQNQRAQERRRGQGARRGGSGY